MQTSFHLLALQNMRTTDTEFLKKTNFHNLQFFFKKLCETTAVSMVSREVKIFFNRGRLGARAKRLARLLNGIKLGCYLFLHHQEESNAQKTNF